MKTSRRTARFLLAPLLFTAMVAALIGWTDHRKTIGSESEAARVISAVLDYDGSFCALNCEFSPCTQYGQGFHTNRFHMEGNDGGIHHMSCWSGGCRMWHSCNPRLTLAPNDLDIVVDLLSELSAEEIVAIHDAEPNVTFNDRRLAVQVLGCQGTVLASVPLATHQHRAFGMSGDR